MVRRNLDLWLVMGVAAVGLAAQMPGVPAIVRVAGGLALVVFCPGYALVAALFPGHTLGWPERTVLGLGLSLAVAMIGAVVFNWSPWGLQAGVWAGLAGAVTFAAGLVAAARRRSEPRTPAFVRVWRAPGMTQWALLGLAGLVTAGAVIWVRVPRTATDVLGYTQLWMVADEQNADRIRLGFNSGELSTTGYRLTVAVDGRLVLVESENGLSPGRKWEREFELPVSQSVSVVEAVLYRLDDPSFVYRRVTLARSVPRS
jgi:hypothetical protein